MSGWAALAGAATGAAGGLLTNYLNSREMKKQREWLEKMSNTAHQREVTDLREAGLNPILSATGGNGASTPSASIVPMEDPIEKGINSALAIRNQQSQINLQESQAAQAQTQAGLNAANAEQAQANTQLVAQQQEYYKGLTDAIPSQIALNNANAKNAGQNARFGTGIAGDVAKLANTGADTISKALPALKGKFDSWFDSASKTASEVGLKVSDLVGNIKKGVSSIPNSAYSATVKNLSTLKSGTD